MVWWSSVGDNLDGGNGDSGQNWELRLPAQPPEPAHPGWAFTPVLNSRSPEATSHLGDRGRESRTGQARPAPGQPWKGQGGKAGGRGRGGAQEGADLLFDHVLVDDGGSEGQGDDVSR